MIWATVSSRYCLCWLYRASPSLDAKNINLISVLTIWWCPCVESCLVFLEEGVCYDQSILLAKLCKSLPCFILYSKAKTYPYLLVNLVLSNFLILTVWSHCLNMHSLLHTVDVFSSISWPLFFFILMSYQWSRVFILRPFTYKHISERTHNTKK